MRSTCFSIDISRYGNIWKGTGNDTNIRDISEDNVSPHHKGTLETGLVTQQTMLIFLWMFTPDFTVHNEHSFTNRQSMGTSRNIGKVMNFCTVSLRVGIANTSRVVPKSLRSPGSPLPVPPPAGIESGDHGGSQTF